EIVGFGPKALALPTMGCVVACRGPQNVTHLIGSEFPYLLSNYDELHTRRHEMLADWYVRNESAIRNMGHDAVQIVIAGWSHAQNRAAGFWFDSSAAEPFGDVDWYVAGPLASDE